MCQNPKKKNKMNILQGKIVQLGLCMKLLRSFYFTVKKYLRVFFDQNWIIKEVIYTYNIK